MRAAMKARGVFRLFIVGMLALATCEVGGAQALPGKLQDGRTLLPNGWVLSPTGQQVAVGELPLNMAVSPDEKYLLVVNNGTGEQSISVVRIDSWEVVQTMPLGRSWLGLRFIDDGKKFLVSGGNNNCVYIFDFDDGRCAVADSIVIGPRWPDAKIWLGGLDVDETDGRIFVCGRETDSLFVLDLPGRSVIRRFHLPAKPYTCLVSKATGNVYVSLWGGAVVAILDKKSFRMVNSVHVGDHPCDMAESRDGGLLYVANANENTVSVVGVQEGKVLETISTAMSPGAPAGSTPNALCLSPDGHRLYIANADNNCLAVMDVSKPGATHALGFIPVGWYPTSVRVLGSSGAILVANAKGTRSMANPHGPVPGKRNRHTQYIGSLFRGTVSKIAAPDATDLARLSTLAYADYRLQNRKVVDRAEEHNPIPSLEGSPSPIKHVFYVIKENRTYDQVFGDLPQGNGDSSLCLFSEQITPNHHALVQEFILLDNLYCDAEVSADGHNWSMGAYATDYVEKSWPTSYGGRGGEYEFEGGYPAAYPSAGYLWDDCKRHGVSYRTYGEFVINPESPGDSARATMESLEGHVAPFYRGWDLGYSDVERIRSWEKEFAQYENSGELPAFQIIKLPNDHTEGTHRGSLTPRAFVAQNDQALGMLVDRISHSAYWKESAIFVIEDDAQNGPDHIDAHRTVGLVISPYTKRHFVDSEMYSTCSMLRTMELILGLPPLSQFDASATPMFNAFTSSPDFSPYRCRDPLIDLNEKNMAGAYGMDRSGEFDFTREDAAPDIELNEIIWKAQRGEASVMPSPVRSAFVRVINGDERQHRDPE